MRVLLLNQTFYPDTASTAQHLADLATGLAGRGHEVTVIAGNRAYDDPGKRFASSETWRGVRIRRVPSTGFGKSSKWRRAADFASFILSACLRLLISKRPCVVVALTSPPLISSIAALYARLTRSRFVYWVMDLNPDEAIAAGWLRADSRAGVALEWLSRFSFRSATKIIALDRFMAGRIEAKGIPTAKIETILPWSHDDQVRFDGRGREEFRAAHGLQNQFVVMYSGNHSPVHPLDALMQAAERLAGEPGISFCFVGGGSEFKRVKRWAETRKLHNVLCLPYQPMEKLSASLSAADAHVVVMGEAMVGLVHPCKIYNMMAVGGTVVYIGPERSHITEILDEPGGDFRAIRVGHADGESLAAQIRAHRLNWGGPRNPQAAGVTKKFSKAAWLPKLIAIIEG